MTGSPFGSSSGASRRAAERAETAEAGSVTAQGLAEAARDSSFANAKGHTTIADARALVADNETFIVYASGAATFDAYRRLTSSTQTFLGRYPAATAIYDKEQEVIARDGYDERFVFFDETAQAVRNLTDAASATRTVTKVTDGLQIALSTGSRTFAFSTGNRVDGGRKVRLRWRGVVSTGTTGSAGVGIFDGTNTTALHFQGSLGRLTLVNTGGGAGIILDIGAVAAAFTVEMEMIIDVLAKTAALFVSINGSAPYSLTLANIAIGDVELIQRNASTCVHSLQIEAIGEFRDDLMDFAAAPEITQIDRNTLNAAVGLLASIRRNAPSGWDVVIPNGYQFYLNSGAYFSSIDLRPILSEYDPDVLVLHVDLATGVDTNAGTADAPLKSLHAAASRCGSGGKTIIKANGGLYPYANCFRNSLSGATTQIVSWDGEAIVSSMHDDTLVWALDTGTTWVATQSAGSFSTVFDASDLTADGDYGALELAADLATCRATPGTWYSTGTSRYVNLHDGREPDSDLRCYVSLVGGASDLYGLRLTVDGQVLYMENLHLEGGSEPLSTRAAVDTYTVTTYANRCAVKYGANNGANVTSNGLQVWQECVAAWNGDDGFNWKGSPFGGRSCLAIEIDCIGRWNGRDAEGTNNGSTQHGGPVIRVNGLYENNQNRDVHDIDSGGFQTFSWNMKCTAGPSQTGDASFAAGIVGGSDITKMWLDSCTAIGGVKDIEAAAAGATIYTSSFTGTGTQTGAGTITSYTP